MTWDKIIVVAISTLSLDFSIISLILTYRQKAYQDKFTTRKTLSDLISGISSTNLEHAKLTGQPITEVVMQLRRNLNSQRRYLCHHAELLSQEIPELCTDVDHTMIARAMDSSGILDRADYHWKKSIELSPAEIAKCYNLRGYARFLIVAGKIQLARSAYSSALEVVPDDGDRARRERADTLIMWAVAERDLGFQSEADRLKEQALAEANRIGSERSRTDMLEYINGHWAAQTN